MQSQFGTLTVNCEVKDGVINYETLNIVKNKRKRYTGRELDNI